MKERIAYTALQKKKMSAEQAAALIEKDMLVAFGGYTSSGYPKSVARELVKRKTEQPDFTIRMLTGANVGPLDTILGGAEIISWRAPMIESKTIAKQANSGSVQYVEQQMNKMPGWVASGIFGKIDIAVVEALYITEEGGIVPTSSVGMVPHFLSRAEKIIVEINTAQPMALAGMHDIYIPEKGQPIPLTDTAERIGKPYMTVDIGKIYAIVESGELDEAASAGEGKPENRKIAENLINFLQAEAKRIPDGKLPPLQTGFGGLAAEIARGLAKSDFTDLAFFCGGITDAVLELIEMGKVRAVSAGSIQMTPKAVRMMEENPALFREKIILRNTDITNRAETIGRMGIIALTSGIEMDMYGNVNSSHIAGTQVVNGLGGGANFAENAALSILLMPSENKGGAISTIVPMVSHQDISEHDIDVVITENGIADLRGKDDRQRAACIIENCAGVHYREKLNAYFERAKKEVGGHHPQLLAEAFSWHICLKQTGTMLDEE